MRPGKVPNMAKNDCESVGESHAQTSWRVQAVRHSSRWTSGGLHSGRGHPSPSRATPVRIDLRDPDPTPIATADVRMIGTQGNWVGGPAGPAR